jgi:hypothetical protein
MLWSIHTDVDTECKTHITKSKKNMITISWTRFKYEQKVKLIGIVLFISESLNN